ncbi:protocatechuate 3,4-dioxygenase subunit alpha [Dietzia sp. CH92]|uniref:protocatechuate 3,4-dioxygenase subunit alpha n=1 Tax=Dietzia sp. CH92 TaxID=3051823 RepID=UPI0028D7F1FB|nr:protocatechuate 3,4-dioxygenase subunit alpha [Dietzia sp. CH92]
MIDTANPQAPRYPALTGRDQDEVPFGVTPSQTVGPYVHIGLEPDWTTSGTLAEPGSPDHIRVSIAVVDGEGTPVADAMIETWQADASGRFVDDVPLVGGSGFTGFSRVFADETGTVTIDTVRPGAIGDGAGGTQAPHLEVGVFARGILKRLVTRLYFPEDVEAHAGDPVLALLPEDRRGLLIADHRDGTYHLTIALQDSPAGPETPFFDL